MANKKIVSVLMAGLMVVSAVGMPNIMPRTGLTESTAIVTSIKASAAGGRLYNQNESQWQKKKYYWNGRGDNLYNSGCGIFSLANAVYALNGKKMGIDGVASWASKNGYWRPGSGGTVRGTLYPNASKVYGGTYNFEVRGSYWGNVKNNTLINGLKNGQVAVAHVPNHFIAITGYNNGKYHVIESAVYSGRNLSGDSWVTASKLSSGKTNVDWFCLIGNKGSSSNSNKYFNRYTGSSCSIIVGLKAIGADSSFDYRKRIYQKNFGTGQNYSGTASQNTNMLNRLRQGNLLKP